MKTNETNNFRENMRTAIVLKATSQRAIAGNAEMSYPYVNRVLQGRAVPSLNVCGKLAKEVGFTVSELLLPPREFKKIAKMAVNAG